MRWDLYCRVIDNHGDLGVCWRLAADLAARGETVRLWIDDASALRWMAPAGRDRLEVRAWPDADAGVAGIEPGDVVVEAFGCELPLHVVQQMTQTRIAPLWINLEYLSAEAFVERSHGLASPQPSGDASGLRKWFFFPGFTPRTGGLIREPDLAARQQAFDARRWLAAFDAARHADERVVSLFCYEQPALPALLDVLARQPTLLLAAAGHAERQLRSMLGDGLRRGMLRAVCMPALTQIDYDHLLWASDLNFVRGEDSFVRAQWAGKPFVWQAYPQHDAAHRVKLDAFLMQLLGAAEPALADAVRAVFRAWNALPGDAPSRVALPPHEPWRRHCLAWRQALRDQADLVTQLIGFVHVRR